MAVALIERSVRYEQRSVRFEQRPWMFEVHTVRDGGEKLLIGYMDVERSKERV